MTWGLIIAVTRNIIPGFQSVVDGNWSRWPFGGQNMLSQMSLGVVGYGRLGKQVASYGQCFGMKVRVFTVPPASGVETRLIFGTALPDTSPSPIASLPKASAGWLGLFGSSNAVSMWRSMLEGIAFEYMSWVKLFREQVRNKIAV